MSVNPGNHQQKGIDGCAPNSPVETSRNKEKPSKDCPGPKGSSDWLENAASSKINIGKQAQCDPIQTGQIVNDVSDPNRDVVYRYSKAIRGCDEAMLDLFNNIVVLDEDGKAHKVPIIWGTQERAVAWMLQDNTKKDGSLVVERIRLPMMAINSSGIEFDQSRYAYHKAIDYLRDNSGKPGLTSKERYEKDTIFGISKGLPINKSYTLMVWTMYMEDIDQIIEQIILKFSPVAYISVRGIRWETIVSLDSIANNVDYEPGDQNKRIIKYEFNFTTQAYIPQPMTRKRSVLSTKVDIHNSVEETEIKEVLSRIEEEVEELEKAIK